MTADLSAHEFLALCSREKLGQVHIQNVYLHGSRYEVTYAESTTQPNRKGDPGQIAQPHHAGDAANQGQLRSVPKLERAGQVPLPRVEEGARQNQEAVGNNQIACPICGTLNETDHCEICAGIERARSLASAKRREYALLKSAQRAQSGTGDTHAGRQVGEPKQTWHSQSDP